LCSPFNRALNTHLNSLQVVDKKGENGDVHRNSLPLLLLLI
jgi:hypothetical protein